MTSKPNQCPQPHQSLPLYLTLLLEYRWIFVFIFLLPISKLFTLFQNLRTLIHRHFYTSPQLHATRIQSIQKQVCQATQTSPSKLLCTARPSWLQVTTRRNNYKKKENAIELPLYDILGLDIEKSVLHVEPGVTVGQITSYLVKRGWTMSVVPELDELTVGGLFMGYGIEGSSHKYGLFSDIVTGCEVVVGDGSLVRCSQGENSDLFRALPWSHGSLGFLVGLDIKVVRCRRFVRLVYEPISGQRKMVKRFGMEAEKVDHEFVEALMFEKERGVLMMGDFADDVRKDDGDAKVNAIGLWYKPWFYKHAESMRKRTVEYIPLRDYYHRHTRSIFWETELILPFGNDPWFRYLFGWLMPPKVSHLKLTQGKTLRDFYQKVHVVQDFLVPLSGLNECLDFGDRIYETYPIWLCPHVLKKTEPQGFLKAPADGKDTEMYIDVGYYGTPRPVLRGERYNAVETTKQFEEYLRNNRGYQTCHAVIYQTREEFREMYDHRLLDQMRQKYRAKNRFMEVYDKVSAN